jgi:ABC-type phosphate transport system substrate-binding protein
MKLTPTDEELKEMKKAREAIAAIRSQMESEGEKELTQEQRKQIYRQMVAEETEKDKQKEQQQTPTVEQIPKKRYEWKTYRRK